MGVSQAGPQAVMQPRGPPQMMGRMPMHQGQPQPGMPMMRSQAPVYQINASPQMVQGNFTVGTN